MKKHIAFASALLLLCSGAFAATYNISAADEFLDSASGARALGMGRAQAAAVQGSAGLFWNPAALAIPHRSNLSADHVVLFEGASLSAIGFSRSLAYGTFGFGMGMVRYSITGAETRDANNLITGSFGESQTALLGGAGYLLSERLALGVTGKYINQSLARDSASAFDADAGALLNLGRYRLGLQARNLLESSLSRPGGSDRLPRTLRLGAAANLLKSLLLAADVVSSTGGNTVIVAGAEFKPIDWAALRAGYDGNFATLGAGASSGDFSFDYAAKKHAIFGFSHSITLNYGFGPATKHRYSLRKWK